MAEVNKWINQVFKCDVLIVGRGSAGCFAAVHAAEMGSKVIIVDKARVGRSGCSPFAAGSINVCLPEDDHQLWFEEIVNRGEYLNDQEWVKIQLEEGFERVSELQEWGKEQGVLVLEEDDGGNFIRRKARGNVNTKTTIINALPMMDTLRKQVLKKGVQLVERVMMTHLLLDQGRVVGAMGINTRSSETFLFQAKSIILAAGGCGFKSLFIGHQNLTGEAQYMAYRAGARLRGLDQAMSNSTARDLDIHGLSLMVGTGGRFLNSQDEEFMWNYEPEIGNRARLTKLVIGMAREVDAGRGPIYFDLTRVSSADQAMLRKILPEGFRAFERSGIDVFKEKVEWVPAFEGTLIHGGGVHIDTACATDVPGLYAAGDTSCTPEHGTWSITGLNLTFCFVSGQRAGVSAAAFASEVSPPDWDSEELYEQIHNGISEILAPVRQPLQVNPDQIAYKLLEILVPYPVAYIRNGSRLQEAIRKVEQLRQENLDRLGARNPHELVKAFEVRSMLVIAEAILKSVHYREESRGFVYREDFPFTDNVNWLKWIMVKQGSQGMEVWAEKFLTPYLQPPLEKYEPR